MLKELSPDLIQRRLTLLFPGESIEDIVRERDVARRHRRIDVTALVWMLILGFTVGGESRITVGFQCAYAAATNQTLSRPSFYDRFTPVLGQSLGDLLESMFEGVAMPHTFAPQPQQFRDAMITDATVFRSCRLLGELPVTYPDQSGAKPHLVYNLTKRMIEWSELTDEQSHESSQFHMGNWSRGRLLLFDLDFYSYRRFALVEENGGFFLSRLEMNTNPRIIEAHRKWRGCTISLPDRRLQDVLGGPTREIIDITAKVSFKRYSRGERHSSVMMEFRVVGVRNGNIDDYHLYITNLPDEFTSEQVAALYGVRREVEVLFHELKSIYGLEKFQAGNPAVTELLVVAALLTLAVSRALLGVLQRVYPETMLPRKRWTKISRSFA